MTEIGMIRQVRKKHFQGIGPSLLDVTPVGPVRVSYMPNLVAVIEVSNVLASCPPGSENGKYMLHERCSCCDLVTTQNLVTVGGVDPGTQKFGGAGTRPWNVVWVLSNVDPETYLFLPCRIWSTWVKR